MKENLKIIPEDLENFSVGEKDNGDGGDCVNNHGFHWQISVPKAISDLDGALMSREMHAYSLSTDGRADSSNAVTQSQKLVASGTSAAYSRSISLPSSSTLVSAMKGGRALNGTIANFDLCVKWAPEVYEPPATSMSHTVKAQLQSPKSKKKDKRKYRGKSSRGNGNERKHEKQKNSNMTKPTNVRVRPKW